jgi:hypothetical protein
MTHVVCAPRYKNRLRVAGLERLEDREMLSADAGLGQWAAAAQGIAAEFGGHTRGVQQFEISIVGTQVSYSPLGLPNDMKGTVYFESATGASSVAIGTYDETLEPIFAPVGPDGSLAFVGASGICTFNFDLTFGRRGGSVTVGSIITSDVAYIEGVQPDGTLLVGSHSSPITAGTGICFGLTGTFDGQSEVRMGATFFMHTTVDFTVTSRIGIDMQEAISDLAVANSIGQAHEHGSSGNAPSDDNRGHERAGLERPECLADRHAAVDSVFADEAAPHSGKSKWS